ncbi:MAG: phosphate acyltransferase PlsX [Bacillota bacterium]|nr:MAG: phosphate acyltransferase PlsX [Bacillota bacterium]
MSGKRRWRIAVDAMGGDGAPAVPVAGGLAAAGRWPVEILWVGDRERVEAELRRQADAPPPGRIVHASQVIEPGDAPVAALRRKRDSTIVVGARLLRDGEADAFVSAGSTGALMAAGKLILGTLPGITRPALAAVLPTLDGRGFLMLDLGASAEADPEQLYQYAVMGALYAAGVLGRPDPKVALLNIGSEAGKGNRLYKETYERLARSGLRFVGNVEARDLFRGPADVVVCDGFTGNVALKAMEGVGEACWRLLKAEVGRSILTTLVASLLRPALERVRRRLDYGEYGAALFLGLNGLLFKCHGSSDARAIANGIGAAVRACEGGLLARIAESIGREDGEALGRGR